MLQKTKSQVNLTVFLSSGRPCGTLIHIMSCRGRVDWAGKMRMVISTELVPAIAAFDPEDPGSAQRATEVKVRVSVNTAIGHR